MCREDGILYKLKEQNPDKEFVMVSSNFVCDDMKKTTLNDLLMAFESLEAGEPINVIELDEEIRSRAQASLDKMLELS